MYHGVILLGKAECSFPPQFPSSGTLSSRAVHDAFEPAAYSSTLASAK